MVNIDSPERTRQSAALAIAIAASLLATIVSLSAIFAVWSSEQLWVIFFKHFPAIIGIPAAAGTAFILVVVLRQIEGPIEITAPGFLLKGSAGQVILWVICFLSLIFALDRLWDK